MGSVGELRSQCQVSAATHTQTQKSERKEKEEEWVRVDEKRDHQTSQQQQPSEFHS